MTDFNIKGLSNRIVASNRLNQDIINNTKGKFTIIPAINQGECQRCGSKYLANLVKDVSYCRFCLNLGRLDSSLKLYLFDKMDNFKKGINYLTWTGKLSDQQQRVSNELNTNLFSFKSHLLWAVTGAGKTEILFSALNKSLAKGNRVAIVSPRIDVCVELYPRFKAAFEGLGITLMHGKREDKYEFNQLVIATVHQMLKFKKAFNTIIVDEVDSYPLFNNELLQQAIFSALKDEGQIIYLSATPPKNILATVEKTYYLPARYHGRPLPVPQYVYVENKKIISNKILKKIQSLINRNQRFVMFFPSIKKLMLFYEEIENKFPDLNATCVSSEEDQRLDIVEKFRNNELLALFTTTILERGVTFKNIDVLIYESDHNNFSKEVLIQIAGRVDRDFKFYDNQIFFYYSKYTDALKNSIKEIKYLNKLAEKLKCDV